MSPGFSLSMEADVPEESSKDLKISDTRETDGRRAQRARLASGLKDWTMTDPQNMEDIVNGQ